MIIAAETGAPFTGAKRYSLTIPLVDGTSKQVEHKAEVSLTWDDLRRIVSDEMTGVDSLITGTLLGVVDGDVVTLIVS